MTCPDFSASRIIAIQSVLLVLRERTVALLSLIFVVLVLVSAWLGWSATSTVNNIFTDATAFLAASGDPVPPNPVLDISPLSLMRNMSIYVALIGALSAIVMGNQLVALDRKAGVVPLIGIRPLVQVDYAAGKVGALACLVLMLAGIAALVSVVTFLLLPGVKPDAFQSLKLAGFFATSALYMLAFGLMGLAGGAAARSESVGLLVPITVWLTLTFIMPALTANLVPTAAINPIAAVGQPPSAAFFRWSGWLLGPVSLAESYKISAAQLLDFLPPGRELRSALPPITDLVLATALASAVAIASLLKMDITGGDYDA